MNKIFFAFAVISAPALASSETAPNSKLSAYFSQEIDRVAMAMESEQSSPAGTPSTPFVMHDVNIDLVPYATFGIGGVANLTVAPEIDFVVAPDSAD